MARYPLQSIHIQHCLQETGVLAINLKILFNQCHSNSTWKGAPSFRKWETCVCYVFWFRSSNSLFPHTTTCQTLLLFLHPCLPPFQNVSFQVLLFVLYLICMILNQNLSLYSKFATAPAATSFTVGFMCAANYFTSLSAVFSSDSQERTWDSLGYHGKQNPSEQKEEVTSISQSCYPKVEELQLFSTGDMDNFILLV